MIILKPERDGEVLDGVDASKQYNYSYVVKEKVVEYSKKTGPSRKKSELTIQAARKREQRGLQNYCMDWSEGNTAIAKIFPNNPSGGIS